jgi:hypothetical protein
MITEFHYHRRDKISALDPERPLFSGIYVPSRADSSTARDLSSTLEGMLRWADTTVLSRVGSGQPRVQTSKPLPERLYDALATVKVMTSKISMHLDRNWRSRLFRRLDELLNPEEWHEDDPILSASSFETYLRFVLLVRPTRDASLGVSNTGNLLAGWIDGRNRLTMELQPGDMVRWVLVRYVDDERETAAAQIGLTRLMQVLAPYQPECWLSLGD